MDFRMTDEQQLLLESVEEFISTCGYDEAYLKDCWNASRQPIEFLNALTEAGFGTLGLPEEYGGTPIDFMTMVLMHEKTYSMGFPNRLDSILELDDILTFGNEKQLNMVAEALADGDVKAFCLGFTEPQAGSDTSSITSTATRRDGKIYLNGHKCFITAAQESKYCLFLTRDLDSPNPPHKAISMWLVPLNLPGVKIEIMHKIGYRIMGSLCDVYFEDVEVDESALVGEEGNGFLQAMKNFEVERILLAASALGMAECAFEDAATYANQRVQFGKPIAAFQMIQQKLVDMAIKIDNMKHYVYKTAWEKDNGLPIQITANLCKIYCAKAAFEVCDDAMQILGGIGYTEEHRVSRLWRDLRLIRIGGGTDEVLTYATAKQLLKKYR